jgi:hypothetical protein
MFTKPKRRKGFYLPPGAQRSALLFNIFFLVGSLEGLARLGMDGESIAAERPLALESCHYLGFRSLLFTFTYFNFHTLLDGMG